MGGWMRGCCHGDIWGGLKAESSPEPIQSWGGLWERRCLTLTFAHCPRDCPWREQSLGSQIRTLSWWLTAGHRGSSGEDEMGGSGPYRRLPESLEDFSPNSPGMKGNSTWSLGQCPGPKPWSKGWGPGVRLQSKWPQEFLFLDPLKCNRGSTGS